MNQNDILTWLQGLIGGGQQLQGGEFQQGIGFNQAQLAAQQAEQAAQLQNALQLQQGGISGQLAVQAPQLALQGHEFDTSQANQMQQQLWNQQFQQLQNQQQQNGLTFPQMQNMQFETALQNNANRSTPTSGTSGGTISPGIGNLIGNSTAAGGIGMPETYAGISGSGTVKPNDPVSLMQFYRWLSSGAA
jgi:hypothetical protein